ncbi:hypothetical protein HN51_063681 [Arachis hypogaea]|uniref:Uncharacterized protein n=1 Tax=Arachis hypogaea TaxID=3818 RepID=A0A445AXA2_ARAHY|nr:uncharacterized protein DS421_11g345300 [Arachis hypogaea]RYR31033.1 hypothetical protein Ahy_B01g055818 [Arachis hypogaea]
MLVLLLKLLAFLVVNIWSLLTRLIFNTIAHTIVLLIQSLKESGEGSQGIFQQVAEVTKACLDFILKQMVNSISYLISKAFGILKDSVAGSVAVTGSVAGGLGEKLKESLVKQVQELIKQIANMVSNMVTDLWNNYKDAVGYVAENV